MLMIPTLRAPWCSSTCCGTCWSSGPPDRGSSKWIFAKCVFFGLFAVCNFSFLGYKVRKSENDIVQHLKDFFLHKSESDCSHLMLLLWGVLLFLRVGDPLLALAWVLALAKSSLNKKTFYWEWKWKWIIKVIPWHKSERNLVAILSRTMKAS